MGLARVYFPSVGVLTSPHARRSMVTLLGETAGDATSGLETPHPVWEFAAVRDALGNGGGDKKIEEDVEEVEEDGPGLGLMPPCRRSALARRRRNK